MTAAALNELQLDAVKQGLQRRFSVVQGPPGTGVVFYGIVWIVSFSVALCGCGDGFMLLKCRKDNILGPFGDCLDQPGAGSNFAQESRGANGLLRPTMQQQGHGVSPCLFAGLVLNKAGCHLKTLGWSI